MYNSSVLLFLAVGAGWLLMFRRCVAFRLRSDFWGMLATLSAMPVLGVMVAWPDCPESYLMAGMLPTFLMVQYALYQATVCEAEKLRVLRREVPRWRLLTGTPAKGFKVAHITAVLRDRRLSLRTLAIAGGAAVAVGVYAVACFGWNSLIVIAVFFWAFMALYQFSFSPDNN